jgi:C-terminal processing protease CtpA/Prc
LGCGGAGEERSWSVIGESFCDEVTQILELSARYHIQYSSEDLPRLYSENMRKTWEEIADTLDAAPHTNDTAKIMMDVKERGLKSGRMFQLKNLYTCSDFTELDRLLSRVEEDLFKDPRLPYWWFLINFANSLDSFSSYLPLIRSSRPSSNNFYHYGVRLDLDLATHFFKPQKEARVLAVSNHLSEIKPGDRIVSVAMSDEDGLESIESLVQKHRSDEFRLTQLTRFFDQNSLPQVEIVYIDGQDPEQKEVKSVLRGAPDDFFQLHRTPSVQLDYENRILYIRIFEFDFEIYEELISKLAEVESSGQEIGGIILDLRFNPGGSVIEMLKVASLFLPPMKVGSQLSRDPSTLALKYKESALYVSPRRKILDQPLIVLANYLSASSSDILTQILSETNRAFFVGSQTFGKGIGQITERLGMISKLGGEFRFTTSQFFGLNGVSAQGRGVSPHWNLLDPQIEKLLADCKESNLKCSPITMNDLIGSKALVRSQKNDWVEPFQLPLELRTYFSIEDQGLAAQLLEATRARGSASDDFDTQRQAAIHLLEGKIKISAQP